MLARMGLLPRKHIVAQNATAMEQEGYEAKQEVRHFKKELIVSRKMLKEFEVVIMTPRELKRHASFSAGCAVMRDILKKEMMETIEKLACQIFALITEGAKLREIKMEIFGLLEKLESYLPTITNLQRIFAVKIGK